MCLLFVRSIISFFHRCFPLWNQHIDQLDICSVLPLSLSASPSSSLSPGPQKHCLLWQVRRFLSLKPCLPLWTGSLRAVVVHCCLNIHASPSLSTPICPPISCSWTPTATWPKFGHPSLSGHSSSEDPDTHIYRNLPLNPPVSAYLLFYILYVCI